MAGDFVQFLLDCLVRHGDDRELLAVVAGRRVADRRVDQVELFPLDGLPLVPPDRPAPSSVSSTLFISMVRLSYSFPKIPIFPKLRAIAALFFQDLRIRSADMRPSPPGLSADRRVRRGIRTFPRQRGGGFLVQPVVFARYAGNHVVPRLERRGLAGQIEVDEYPGRRALS